MHGYRWLVNQYQRTLIQEKLIYYCFMFAVSLTDPVQLPRVPLTILLSHQCVSIYNYFLHRFIHFNPFFLCCFSSCCVLSFNSALICLSPCHRPLTIAERECRRYFTEQTSYNLGSGPVSYVSFSCCMALPCPSAIDTHTHTHLNKLSFAWVQSGIPVGFPRHR